jgi:lysophospholipase L1-like esterase
VTARPITGWGDSNMAALGGTSGSKLTAILGTRFGVTAFNGATSGDWSKHTAADMNALPALVTLSGGNMPASGSVTCTISNIGIDGNNGTGFTGTLLGIPCSITFNSTTDVWTCTRTGSGSVTAIPSGTPLQSTAGLAHRDGEVVLIWVGKNDANLTADLNDTVDNIQACVDYLTGDYRYLVLGHFVDTAHTTPGAWSRERVFDLNDLLATAHGANFVDISAYVASSQIWTDAGVTPNSTDLTAQTNLVLPPSLAADYGHLNTAGNNAVGLMVGDYIDSLGWYDEEAPVVGFRGASSASSTTSVSSINLTIPADAVVGEIAYIAHPFNHNSDTQDTTTPTGWTLVDTQTFSTSMRSKLYRKTLVSGDPGATVTLTNAAPQRLSAAMGVLSGVAAQDVVVARVENVATPATNAAPTATVTTGKVDVALAFWTERSSTPSTTIAPPTGFTLPTTGGSAFSVGTGATSSAVAHNLTTVTGNGSATVGGGSWDPDGTNPGVIMWVVGVEVAAVTHLATGNRTATASVVGGATVTHLATGNRTATATITGTADKGKTADGNRTATASITGSADVTGTGPVPVPTTPGDMPPRRIRIDVYDEDMNRLGRVGEYMQADINLKHNQIGSWSFLLDVTAKNTSLLPVKGRRVVLSFEDDGRFLMSGPVVSWEKNVTVGELKTVSVAGYDDKYWLDQRLAFPLPGATFPAEGTAFTQAAYQDLRTGSGESVAKAFINANLARLPIPHFTVAPSLGRGSTVTYAARMHQLLWMVFISCTYSGLGFDVRQIDGQLVFDVYEPSEQPVRLSEKLGNLISFKYRALAPKVSHAVAGGTGEGTARKFMQKSLPASATGWGIHEAYLDVTDADTDAVLLERVDSFLAEGGPALGFSIVPRDTRAMQFGRDYNLGDKVRVDGYDGETITDTVRQVQIAHTAQDGLLITPGIGYTESTEPTAAIYRTYRRFREEFENFKRSI